MKQTILFLYLSVSGLLLSQEASQVQIYVNHYENVFSNFEKTLIEEIVNLYNKKGGKGELKVKFVKYKRFNSLFEILDETKPDDNIMGINVISITQERQKKYDFSRPYFQNKQVLLSKKHTTYSPNKVNRISYTRNSLNANVMESFSKANPFVAVPYDDFDVRYSELTQGTDDYAFGDYVDQWAYNFNVVQTFNSFGTDYFGIIFPKNSELKEKLKPYIAYYINSIAYLNLIRHSFGKDAARFFRSNRKSK